MFDLFSFRFEKSIINKGFTLAEVLITLLIIGVVSSIVIPSIIQNSQDAELKAAWKKAYSDISQATMKIQMDLGGTISFVDDDDMINQYLNHLSYVQRCSGSNWGGNCWHKPGDIKYYSGTLLTSANMSDEFGNNPSIITPNGSMILFARWNCDSTSFCGHINIDVNGLKGPNIIGKDVFRIWVLKNQIQPQGSPTSRYVGTCPGHGGFDCATLYLYN